MNVKLVRSQTDKMIGGVCGGLGPYLGIDPTWVRLFFVVLGLSNGGIGLLLYFVLWVVMPLEGTPATGNLADAIGTSTQEMADRARNLGQDIRDNIVPRQRQVAMFGGIILVALGAILLVQNMGIPWLAWLKFDQLWPILLILGGIVLLVRQSRGNN